MCSSDLDKENEKAVIAYALAHRKMFGMIGGLIRAEGKVVAFTLGERLTEDKFDVHFERHTQMYKVRMP